MTAKINPVLLAAIVAAVKAELAKAPVAAAAAKPAKAKPDLREKRKVELDALTVAAFKAKGISNVEPRVNVLTAKRWAEKGKTIKAGQEPVWVKAPWMTAKQMGYPMFHASQVS